MRHLSNEFMAELKKNSLNPLLKYVKNDNTLDLEIRENYINIYYRGGNLLKVSQKKSRYEFDFDEKYLNKNLPAHLSHVIPHFKKHADWDNYIPLAKQAMDFYFTNNKKEEREFQQLVVRENNNSSIANGTDYFIIDIEYDNQDNARFDLVAVEWPSDASFRKLSKNFKPKLVVFEMKYGDGAMKGKAGINKHISDFNSFKANSIKYCDFKNEMLGILKQKRELGLIPCLSETGNNNQVKEFSDDIEMIFLLANHDPASKILNDELSALSDPDLKFITSSFMGYGLYLESVFNLSSFLNRYNRQIYSEV